MQTHSLPAPCLCMFIGRTQCMCVSLSASLKFMWHFARFFPSLIHSGAGVLVLYTIPTSPESKLMTRNEEENNICYCAPIIQCPSRRNNGNFHQTDSLTRTCFFLFKMNTQFGAVAISLAMYCFRFSANKLRIKECNFLSLNFHSAKVKRRLQYLFWKLNHPQWKWESQNSSKTLNWSHFACFWQ